MADRAVQMAKEGAERIAVLGVDFMSENVRAMPTADTRTPVYRASDADWLLARRGRRVERVSSHLERAHERPHALHVVYINTSLWTKAAQSPCRPSPAPRRTW